MTARADIAIMDNLGTFIAVFEVKRKLSTSPEWAVSLRRNLVTHGVLPGHIAWSVVATPDRLYIWHAPVDSGSPPTYILDAEPFFGPLFRTLGTSANDIAPDAFEMLVAAWLTNVLAAKEPVNIPPSLQELAEIAREGRVEVQAAA